MAHLDSDALAAALDGIRAAPAEVGVLDLVVRRPSVGDREILDEGRLAFAVGLVGDTWSQRSSKRTGDGSPHPEMQLNVMNSRVTRLIADTDDKAAWAMAGDQLYVDLDISVANLPAGTRLRIGETTIEITLQPHNGCAKFTQRFGLDAHRFVNSDVGKALRMRGANAKVIVEGIVRPGDAVVREPHTATSAVTESAPAR